MEVEIERLAINNISQERGKKGVEVAFKNLIWGYYKLRRSLGSEFEVRHPGYLVLLAGVKEAFGEKSLDPKRAKTAPVVVLLGTTMNDLADIGTVLHPEKRKMYPQREKTTFLLGEEITLFEYFRRRYHRYREMSKKLVSELSLEDRRALRNHTLEVFFLEASAKKRTSWNYEEIKRYREMVNAVNIMTVLAVILGPERFKQRLGTIPPQKLSLESIYQKYSWLIEGRGENKDERACELLFNLTMGAQVVDDLYGVELDKSLGINSFATEAQKLHPGDNKAYKKMLLDIRNEYYQNAKKGISNLAVTTLNLLANTVSYCLNRLPKEVRSKKKLKWGLENLPVISTIWRRNIPHREKMYASGEI